VEALEKLGYGGPSVADAWGISISRDYARYIERTSSEPNRWDKLAAGRPESLVLWYRTSPVPLVPLGGAEPVRSGNPPLRTGGMTITVVDGAGRLGEFRAVPLPFDTDAPAGEVDWKTLFDLAGLPFDSFTPVAPRFVPPAYAGERRAWEGHAPE